MSGEILVVDASVAIKWVVAEQDSGDADALLDGRRLAAPDLLMAECANVLWRKVKRGELTATEAEVAARLLEQCDVELMPMRGLLRPATELAIRAVHPAYDCIYLSLAAANGWTFVTADESLVRKIRQRPLTARAYAVCTLAEAVADI